MYIHLCELTYTYIQISGNGSARSKGKFLQNVVHIAKQTR